MPSFVHEKHWLNTENYTRLNETRRNTRNAHLKYLPAFLSMSHSLPHMWSLVSDNPPFDTSLIVGKKRRITFKRYPILNDLKSVVFALICRKVQPFSCHLILKLFHRKLNRTCLSLKSNLFRNRIFVQI